MEHDQTADDWILEWELYHNSLNNIKYLLDRFIIFHERGQEYKHPHSDLPKLYWQAYRALVILILKNENFHPVARLHAAAPLPQKKLYNINIHDTINHYEQALNKHEPADQYIATATDTLPTLIQAVTQLDKEKWQPVPKKR